MEKIYVFGRGDYFKNKSKQFLERFQIVGFLDNAVCEDLVDDTYDIPVYNPKRISELDNYDIFCVATDFFGMWKQLTELGVDSSRIRFGAEIQPQQSGIEQAAFANGERLRAEAGELVYTCAGKEYRITCLDELKGVLRMKAKENNCDIDLIRKLHDTPISRTFGSERGKAVDRYFIESFLQTHANDVKGTVMEVLNNQYTMMYGKKRVEKSIVCHVLGWGKNAVKVNFETGEGIVDNSVDCLICTQTLQYIFDLPRAIQNIYKVLKPGGVALITVPGIKPLCEYDSNLWGEYWSFTADSVDKLCNTVADKEHYEVRQYGNSKVAVAYLYGLCIEEIEQKDLDYYDEQYPFIVGARIVKSECHS